MHRRWLYESLYTDILIVWNVTNTPYTRLLHFAFWKLSEPFWLSLFHLRLIISPTVPYFAYAFFISPMVPPWFEFSSKIKIEFSRRSVIIIILWYLIHNSLIFWSVTNFCTLTLTLTLCSFVHINPYPYLALISDIYFFNPAIYPKLVFFLVR